MDIFRPTVRQFVFLEITNLYKYFTMFKAVKEIIWHLTCANCKGWFTFATMDERYCIDRATFYCPHCGTKARCEKKVDKQ